MISINRFVSRFFLATSILFVVLISAGTLFLYRTYIASLRESARESLKYTFDLHRSELLGNLILEERQLLAESLRKIEAERGIKARLDLPAGSRLKGPILSTEAHPGQRNPSADEPFSLFESTASFPIHLGEKRLGELTLLIEVPVTLFDFSRQTLPFLIAGLAVLGGASAYGSWSVRRHIVGPLERIADEKGLDQEEDISITEIAILAENLRVSKAKLEKSSRLEGIVQATQALAHDLRKPFSMAKAILGVMPKLKSMEDVGSFVSDVTPEIDESFHQVDSMINDILTFGRRQQANTQPVRLFVPLRTALSQVFRSRMDAEVPLDFGGFDDAPSMLDKDKFTRVLANLIDNAVQAMGSNRGRLWFRTRVDPGAGVVSLFVGNSGSKIPPGIRDRLFEPFVTFGKAQGTGLGLANCRGILEAHSGSISVESDVSPEFPDGFVEFELRFPGVRESAALGPAHTDFPTSSRHFRRREDPDSTGGHATSGDSSLSKAALERLSARPLGVVVCDDEHAYREYVRAIFESLWAQSNAKSIPLFEIDTYESADAALARASEANWEFGLIDLDMPGQRSGLDLVRALASRGLRVIVHSNRVGASAIKASMEAGAFLHLPKPLTPEHLGRLVSDFCMHGNNLSMLDKA